MTAPTDPASRARWTAEKRARARMPARPLTVDPYTVQFFHDEAFPKRPPLAASPEWVTGTWASGSAWKNPNPLYGAYPRGYLRRVHSCFPFSRKILHVFSGGLDRDQAVATVLLAQREAMLRVGGEGVPEVQAMELVDLKGPEDGRHPTWQGDVLALPEEWAERFDLVLADPPYSEEDAAKYGVKMPLRHEVTHALRRVTMKGGVLVWLDTVWPQHRKEQWRCFGQIGVVRSTNHRVRLCSMFEAV